jgi:hypothetical protein
MNSESDLIFNSIQDLPFSEVLKKVLQQSGIENLKQLTDMYVSDWHKNIPGFNYHHQFEILDYVDKNGLYSYIKE